MVSFFELLCKFLQLLSSIAQVFYCLLLLKRRFLINILQVGNLSLLFIQLFFGDIEFFLSLNPILNRHFKS